MTATWTNWPTAILDTLRDGTVIPAHLLALIRGASSMFADNGH